MIIVITYYKYGLVCCFSYLLRAATLLKNLELSYCQSGLPQRCREGMEQSAAVDRVVAVTTAVQTGTENRTVPSIVRRRTSLKTIIEHCNDATAALQSSWKTSIAPL
jgi:hypothetical protein